MMKKAALFVLPAKLLQRLQLVRKQSRNFKSIAKVYGQWRSIIEGDSVDSNADPIPWYTYPAVEYLSHLDLTRFKVFEYGSGNSTIWWAKRAKQVTSVEDDEGWYKKINNRIERDFYKISYVFEKDPVRYSTIATNDFDIFIVDGNYRRECLEHVVGLGGGVMLILDNSDWYPKAVRFIQETLGWVQVDFHGFGPINDYTWITSIFINPARHSELSYRMSLKSARGLAQIAVGDY